MWKRKKKGEPNWGFPPLMFLSRAKGGVGEGRERKKSSSQGFVDNGMKGRLRGGEKGGLSWGRSTKITKWFPNLTHRLGKRTSGEKS